MRIQCDTLKYARLLGKKGVKSDAASGIMSTLTEIEIFNIYSKHEVDSMLSEAIKEVFAVQNQKLEEQRREFDARMLDTARFHEQQIRDNKSELLASRRESRSDALTSRRWIVGTMISVGLSLAAYLSAILHFNH